MKSFMFKDWEANKSNTCLNRMFIGIDNYDNDINGSIKIYTNEDYPYTIYNIGYTCVIYYNPDFITCDSIISFQSKSLYEAKIRSNLFLLGKGIAISPFDGVKDEDKKC
jgi:hypothetical protein